MKRLWIAALAAACLAWGGGVSAAERPNVIWIMADDMGWGDAGCYGQKKIKTPNIDRIAAEGMRFTSAYCSTSVCAPCRCGLMTGLHIGHAPIRANVEIQPEGQKPMPAGTYTVAKLFKSAGYATGLVGKWGLGFPGSESTPDKMGFDYFFGYNCQRKAHEYYPEYLWRNNEKVMLGGKEYSHDLIAAEGLKWIREHKGGPFFLYVPFTIPHQKFEVPDQGPYKDEPWPQIEKNYAAMITRMDGSIGQMLALLKELGIEEKTLVFFTSDNGPNPPFIKAFDSNGPWRAGKRELYEGGLREPMVVRWPGKVPAGRVSDEPWAFYDFLATAAELTGTKLPEGVHTDGISILPALLGGQLPKREFLYFEIQEPYTAKAVRMGDWKLVKRGVTPPVELYDLKGDPGEEHNVAGQNPDVVKKMTAIMEKQHTDSPDWPTKDVPRNAGKKKGKGKKE